MLSYISIIAGLASFIIVDNQTKVKVLKRAAVGARTVATCGILLVPIPVAATRWLKLMFGASNTLL